MHGEGAGAGSSAEMLGPRVEAPLHIGLSRDAGKSAVSASAQDLDPWDVPLESRL